MTLSITDNFALAKWIINVLYVAISDGFIYLPCCIPAPLFVLERNILNSFDCHQGKYEVIAVFGTLVQLFDKYFILGLDNR